MTPEELLAGLAVSGLNLWGSLGAREYDRLVPPAWRTERVQPDCRSVLLVGNAGPGLWSAFRGSPESRVGRDPLDRFTSRVLRDAAGRLRPPATVAIYTERREGCFLPLLPLAEQAGLGAPGRLGMLLHPVHGPWISLRGALFLRQPAPCRRTERFEPCRGCAAPCVRACPGHALEGPQLNPRACFRSKILSPSCRRACNARAACVLGTAHAFPPEQIAHHSRIRWRPSILRQALRVLVG